MIRSEMPTIPDADPAERIASPPPARPGDALVELGDEAFSLDTQGRIIVTVTGTAGLYAASSDRSMQLMRRLMMVPRAPWSEGRAATPPPAPVMAWEVEERMNRVAVVLLLVAIVMMTILLYLAWRK